MGRFEETINNVKAFCTDNPETKMYIGEVYLDDIYIDKEYQGYRKHKKTQSLSANWDISDYNPIKVVPRYDLKKFSVYEGQNRVLAARDRGMKKLVASFSLGEGLKPAGNAQKFEAMHFIRQNKEVEPITPIQKHGALLLAGDETAKLLEAMRKRFCFQILTAASSGNKGAGILGSYGDTYSRLAPHVRNGDGERMAAFIFSTIYDTGWIFEPNGMCRAVIRSLAKLYEAHPDEADQMNDCLWRWARKKRNSKKMTNDGRSKSSVSKVLADSKEKYKDRHDDAALTLYLEDILTDDKSGVLVRRIYKDYGSRGLIVQKGA